jgi:hypothetical protein
MQDSRKVVTGPFDRVSPEVAERVETTRHETRRGLGLTDSRRESNMFPGKACREYSTDSITIAQSPTLGAQSPSREWLARIYPLIWNLAECPGAAYRKLNAIRESWPSHLVEGYIRCR